MTLTNLTYEQQKDIVKMTTPTKQEALEAWNKAWELVENNFQCKHDTDGLLLVLGSHFGAMRNYINGGGWMPIETMPRFKRSVEVIGVYKECEEGGIWHTEDTGWRELPTPPESEE